MGCLPLINWWFGFVPSIIIHCMSVFSKFELIFNGCFIIFAAVVSSPIRVRPSGSFWAFQIAPITLLPFFPARKLELNLRSISPLRKICEQKLIQLLDKSTRNPSCVSYKSTSINFARGHYLFLVNSKQWKTGKSMALRYPDVSLKQAVGLEKIG